MKENNTLYSDIGIAIENIPNNLLSLSDERDNLENQQISDTSEEDENPLDLLRFNSQETMFVSNVPTPEEISIAPGEGKQPTSVLNDIFCEGLSFPYLFPNGHFGYKVERQVNLSPVKYFNQRLLNYTQMFASDPDYIFFALSVSQQLKLQSQINIGMKKFVVAI